MNQDEKIRRLIRRMSAVAARSGLPLPTNPAAVERLALEWWTWMCEWNLLPRTAQGRQVSLQVKRRAEYETLFVALYV